MGNLERSRVARSATSYNSMELAESNTEAVIVSEPSRNLVLEITPYPSSGIAQVVTMTPEQSVRIAEYLRYQFRWLLDLNRPDLLVDITYVPERNWNKDTLRRVPSGSAIFPVLDVTTVPHESVKSYLP